MKRTPEIITRLNEQITRIESRQLQAETEIMARLNERINRLETGSAAVVSEYMLLSGNGQYIRMATKVTFADGRVVKFLDRMSKRDAIRQAMQVQHS